MTARRVTELDVHERRVAIARTIAEITASWLIVLGLYYLLPVDASRGYSLVVRVVAIVVVMTVVLVWQVTRILSARLPELRAASAAGFIIPLFFALFATTYLAMSHAAATTFTESLDHTRALYFTITVFSTVGFGDITPRTDPARGVVMAQMILDLIVIGIVFRVLFTAARRAGNGDPPADGG